MKTFHFILMKRHSLKMMNHPDFSRWTCLSCVFAPHKIKSIQVRAQLKLGLQPFPLTFINSKIVSLFSFTFCLLFLPQNLSLFLQLQKHFCFLKWVRTKAKVGELNSLNIPVSHLVIFEDVWKFFFRTEKYQNVKLIVFAIFLSTKQINSVKIVAIEM